VTGDRADASASAGTYRRRMTMIFPAQRMTMIAHAPRPYAAMMRLEAAVEVDDDLRELIKLRASQINGCAFCIDMHWKDARAAGESEERLYTLDAWRESPLYSDRERAALELCEAITLVAETHVPDDVWERPRPSSTPRSSRSSSSPSRPSTPGTGS
jgi:AhpD family alkylhydroperoxidase